MDIMLACLLGQGRAGQGRRKEKHEQTSGQSKIRENTYNLVGFLLLSKKKPAMYDSLCTAGVDLFQVLDVQPLT